MFRKRSLRVHLEKTPRTEETEPIDEDKFYNRSVIIGATVGNVVQRIVVGAIVYKGVSGVIQIIINESAKSHK